MIAIDVSALPGAVLGAPVTLWGEGLSADEVGAAAGTLSYELFTKVTARVPMAANVENLGTLERRVSMSVPVRDIEKQVDERLKQLARNVKMPGFRPGKVPMKIVAQTYGPQVRNEVLGDAVQKSFSDAVKEANLRVAGYPKIERKEEKPADAAADVLEFSATFEIYPEVKPGDLSAATLEQPKVVVDDAAVSRTIEVLRKQRTKFVAAERPAQDGDRLTVDFNGTIDGVPFEGGAAQNFVFALGAGSMRRALLSAFDQYVKLNKKIPPEILTSLSGIDEAGRLADTVAAHLPLKLEQKQQVLEMFDVKARLEHLLSQLETEIDILQVEKRIRGRVKRQMEKSQREYYLNEQVKAIQKELGEGDENADLDEMEKKIKAARMLMGPSLATRRRIDRVGAEMRRGIENPVVHHRSRGECRDLA